MPSGNKPLPAPMLTQIYAISWTSGCQRVMSHKICSPYYFPLLFVLILIFFLQILVLHLPISFRVTALVLAQLHDCPSGSKVNLNDVIKLNHIQTKPKTPKKAQTLCKMNGMYSLKQKCCHVDNFFQIWMYQKVVKVDNFWYTQWQNFYQHDISVSVL